MNQSFALGVLVGGTFVYAMQSVAGHTKAGATHAFLLCMFLGGIGYLLNT